MVVRSLQPMRVVRLNANKIGIGRRATRRLTGFGARAPRFEELVLPKSFEIGNISLNKAVIWWMSDKVDDRKAVPQFQFKREPRRETHHVQDLCSTRDFARALYDCIRSQWHLLH